MNVRREPEDQKTKPSYKYHVGYIIGSRDEPRVADKLQFVGDTTVRAKCIIKTEEDVQDLKDAIRHKYIDDPKLTIKDDWVVVITGWSKLDG
jgi:hypothetical protein